MAAPIDALFAGNFAILGSRVPLRPGTWRLLADIRKFDTATSSARSFLGRIEDGRLQEAIRILSVANTSEKAETYGRLRFFENELYRVVEEDQENGTQSVWVIKNAITWPWSCFRDRTTGISDLEMLVAERLFQGRINFPREFLLVQFTRREQSKALEVTYYLNPQSAGVPLTRRHLQTWQESDFAPKHIRAHPEKFAFFRGNVEWGEMWWPKIKSSFLDFYPEGF
ncbi:MAG: hypothetical protein WA840_09305 [Caulobacteraceae bacterium]